MRRPGWADGLLLGLVLGLLAPSAPAATLAVIAAPARAGSTLDAARLGLIFQRKLAYWDDGSRYQPANLPADHPGRRQFSLGVFGLEPAALDDYWRERYFHGVRPPYVVASQEAMLRFVSETPGALGYVEACSADQRVTVLGYLLEDGRYSPERPPQDCAGR